MDCCKHCNFRNTSNCKLFAISEQLENEEISEEEARIEYENILIDCEIDYHDHQIRESEID